MKKNKASVRREAAKIQHLILQPKHSFHILYSLNFSTSLCSETEQIQPPISSIPSTLLFNFVGSHLTPFMEIEHVQSIQIHSFPPPPKKKPVSTQVQLIRLPKSTLIIHCSKFPMSFAKNPLRSSSLPTPIKIDIESNPPNDIRTDFATSNMSFLAFTRLRDRGDGYSLDQSFF